MQDSYGYLKGTNSKDGEAVDVFIKPGTAKDFAGEGSTVRQINPEQTGLMNGKS